jgi:hypothetical protein
MSDNDFRAPRLKPGSPLRANDLNKFTNAAKQTPLRRNYGGLTRRSSTGQTFVPHVQPSSSGGSLVYATSPNTTLDASFTYGASFDEPEGTGTALTDAAAFYLSTPWNTRITAPDKLFTFWNNIGDNYYLPITTFYIKPSVDYSASAGAGISTFTCYYNKVATLSLGTNTAFPATVKALLDGFTATGASASVRGYFNGKIFPASYDSENNIVYIDHPIY